MAWWIWFLIGAAFGLATQLLQWARNPTAAVAIFQRGHPIQGLLFVAFLGAATVGTILWVVFGLIFRF